MQIQCNNTVATVNCLKSLCTCKTCIHGIKTETVVIVSVTLANRVVKQGIVNRMDSQIQGEG